MGHPEFDFSHFMRSANEKIFMAKNFLWLDKALQKGY
jgi:hypothetical protein